MSCLHPEDGNGDPDSGPLAGAMIASHSWLCISWTWALHSTPADLGFPDSCRATPRFGIARAKAINLAIATSADVQGNPVGWSGGLFDLDGLLLYCPAVYGCKRVCNSWRARTGWTRAFIS